VIGPAPLQRRSDHPLHRNKERDETQNPGHRLGGAAAEEPHQEALRSAADLYGATSAEYAAVERAWAAVNVR
jgi:hypothetical protein